MFEKLLKKSKFKDELDEILSECDRQLDDLDRINGEDYYKDMNLKEVEFTNEDNNINDELLLGDYESGEYIDNEASMKIGDYIEKYANEEYDEEDEDELDPKVREKKQKKKEKMIKKLKKSIEKNRAKDEVKEVEVDNEELLQQMLEERRKLEQELRQAGFLENESEVDLSEDGISLEEVTSNASTEVFKEDEEDEKFEEVLEDEVVEDVVEDEVEELEDDMQEFVVRDSKEQDDIQEIQEKLYEEESPIGNLQDSIDEVVDGKSLEDNVLISDEEIEAIDILFSLDEEMKDDDERLKYIKDNCEQIVNANKEIEDICVEYKIVASYISDIQKIEMSDNPDRKRLIETARKIEEIVRDKEKLRERSDKQLKVSQRTILERYEDNIVDEIENMKNYEREHQDIKHDLSKLEIEKNLIKEEKEGIESFQVFLSKLARGVVITAGVLYIVFVLIAIASNVEMFIPIAVTTVLGAVGALYVILSSKKNEQGIILCDKKMNKLIKILNKTKIKYVNSTKLVEYVRNKYEVANSKELAYLWDRYLMEKDLRDKIFENTEMLTVYLNIFKRELSKFGLDDVDVWKNQVGVIAHQEELATLRNNLDERRVDLKERIDYNNRLYELGITNLRNIRNINLEYREEVDFLLDRYDLDVKEEF